MAMSKKHYTAIADVLNRWYLYYGDDSPQEITVIDLLAQDFADVFAADNPNFDANRFADAVYAARKEQ